MHLSSIEQSIEGLGAWIVNHDDLYKFDQVDDADDPYHPVMDYVFSCGGAILVRKLDRSELLYFGGKCRPKTLETAINLSSFPLVMIDREYTISKRDAVNREEAEAIVEDILLYRNLSFTDHTTVIRRDPRQIASSGRLIRSTLEAWQLNTSIETNELLEVAPCKGFYPLTHAGPQSLAVQFMGDSWREQPNEPAGPQHYESAATAVYSEVANSKQPALDDISGWLTAGGKTFNIFYRRLVVPQTLGDGSIRLLIASEPIHNVIASS